MPTSIEMGLSNSSIGMRSVWLEGMDMERRVGGPNFTLLAHLHHDENKNFLASLITSHKINLIKN